MGIKKKENCSSEREMKHEKVHRKAVFTWKNSHRRASSRIERVIVTITFPQITHENTSWRGCGWKSQFEVSLKFSSGGGRGEIGRLLNMSNRVTRHDPDNRECCNYLTVAWAFSLSREHANRSGNSQLWQVVRLAYILVFSLISGREKRRMKVIDCNYSQRHGKFYCDKST